MAGCRLLADACAPNSDPYSQGEIDNEALVRQFIEEVWNEPWTTQEDEDGLGDNTYMPQRIDDSIDALADDDYDRHRLAVEITNGAVTGTERKSGAGKADFRLCVNAVHAVCPNLNIEVAEALVQGDYVLCQLILTGSNRTGPGILGIVPPPVPFRTVASAVYRVANGKIREDWLVGATDNLLRQVARTLAPPIPFGD
jgi:predicted ester cyclase